MSATRSLSLLGLGFSLLLWFHGVTSQLISYSDALTKSLLYFEAQRSGKLPSNQRVDWRGDSALKDGSDVGIDLVGGYYDAGDNVKYGFPMAFTITMLAWSVVDFEKHLAAKNELQNALDAIRWGTDYLLKTHPKSNFLYAQVGDGDSDNACWQRPEDMTTPRVSYHIDADHPGADLAGETAAAFAAASIALKKSDPIYSELLLAHAKQLWDFCTKNKGRYSDSIPEAHFYASSGYEDEQLWAATWIHRALGPSVEDEYFGYIMGDQGGGTRQMFSWNDKYVGAQLAVVRASLAGEFGGGTAPQQYTTPFVDYVCNCVQKGISNVKMTNGGLLWFDELNNLQYVSSTLLVIASYSEYLRTAQVNLQCPNSVTVTPDELHRFILSQVDYILGRNPNKMSYMVGYGENYPKQIHHRAASIWSIKKYPKPVTCNKGKALYNKNASDPNVLVGAIVGGPDEDDVYTDARTNLRQAEPAIFNTAPLVGVFALLASS